MDVFIHGLAASVWAQVKKNVSHGCLNLSPARAKEYYDGVLTGDPVEITGSTQTLSAKDGELIKVKKIVRTALR